MWAALNQNIPHLSPELFTCPVLVKKTYCLSVTSPECKGILIALSYRAGDVQQGQLVGTAVATVTTPLVMPN